MKTKHSLRKTYFYSVILVILIVIALAGTLYTWFAQQDRRYALKMFESLTSKAEQSIANALDEIQRAARLSSYSKHTQSFLLADNALQRLESQYAMADLHASLLDSHPNIREIAFLTPQGALHQSSGTYTAIMYSALKEPSHIQDFYTKTPFFSTVFFGEDDDEKEIPYFLYIYPVYAILEGEFSPDNIALCVILAQLNDVMKRAVVGIENQALEVAFLEDDTILLMSSSADPAKQRALVHLQDGRSRFAIGGKKYLGFRHNLEGTRWNTIVFADEKVLMAETIALKHTVTIFLSIVLALFLVFVYYGLKAIYNPIHGLLEGIKKIPTNPADNNRLPDSPVEEIQLLTQSINEMLAQIELITKRQEITQAKLYQAALSEQQAQLSYYHSQINPHFLYNTLECIRSMAQAYHAPPIEEMSLSMARMFRYAVQSDLTASVTNELSHVKDYFSVMNMRAAARYQLKVTVSDEAARCPIQRMLLQPLVENAIQHGFEGRDPPCVISIQGWVSDAAQGRRLHLRVVDNGYGMSPEQLQTLRTHWEQAVFLEADASSFLSRQGIGLLNIYKRLALGYRGAASIDISSKRGHYTSVLLKIPLDKGGSGDATVQRDDDR